MDNWTFITWTVDPNRRKKLNLRLQKPAARARGAGPVATDDHLTIQRKDIMLCPDDDICLLLEEAPNCLFEEESATILLRENVYGVITQSIVEKVHNHIANLQPDFGEHHGCSGSPKSAV